MKIENISKQLKISQMVLIVFIIGKEKINIWCKLEVPAAICFRVTTKTKIDFVKNHFFLNFLFLFPGAFENYLYWEF